MVNERASAWSALASTSSTAFLASGVGRLFASRDVDETCSEVARVMKPHRLRPIRERGTVEARMHHAALGDLSLSRLRYGADVDVEPERLEDFYLLLMPIEGSAEIRLDGRSHSCSPGRPVIVSPHQPLSMRWSADSDQLMLRVSRSLLERRLVASLGQPLTDPLEFSPSFDAYQNPTWQCLMRFLVDCAEQQLGTARHAPWLAEVQGMVAGALLSEQPHNYRERPARRTVVQPRHVKRVIEYLHSHAHEPVCATQLAAVAGVSLRGLYAGFQSYCGVSPMQYLRDLRLDLARKDLLTGAGRVTVAGVAMRWGCTHLSRFSADYKARFGELPSETLRRS